MVEQDLAAKYVDAYCRALMDTVSYVKEYKNMESIAEKTCEGTRRLLSHYDDEMYVAMKLGLCELANSYTRSGQDPNFVSEHLPAAVSHNFRDACDKGNVINGFSLDITVGNVSFKGKSLFEVDSDSIDLLAEPNKTNKVLPTYHCWLSLDGIAVIDLIINSDFYEEGILNRQELDACPTRLWPDHERSELIEYVPLLVDNSFVVRLSERLGL